MIRAAGEGVAGDEDRLPAAEAVGVRIAHRAVAEPLELYVSLPEPFLEVDGVAVHAEPRAVERRLRVEAVVDERRDELDVGLCLDEALRHLDSWAKDIAALFTMSRSSVTRTRSRFRRATATRP